MSRHEFTLPELGDGQSEAEVIGWLVEQGRPVVEHQPLVEVQTDKAVVELPAPVTGVLVSHGCAPGDRLKVGALLATFDVEAAALPVPPAATPTATPARRPLAAPVVRQLARELGVDLATVTASGPGGRISRDDVQAAAVAGVEPAPTVSAVTDVRTATATDDVRRVPLRGLRRAIARRMTEALRTVPHVTGLIEIDVTELSGVLDSLRPVAEQEGVRLTWTALFALATVQALTEFPQLNASLDDAREEIVQHRRVHLGIATDTDDGLLVPVVRGADRLSLLELAAAITRAGDAARNRTATHRELSGGTFTLTNYGAVGGWHGTPMVNVPETGIVGFGRVEPRPAVVDGALAVRTMVALSHTVDHRLIDGAVNARFGAAIRRRLEQPHLLLLGAQPAPGSAPW